MAAALVGGGVVVPAAAAAARAQAVDLIGPAGSRDAGQLRRPREAADAECAARVLPHGAGVVLHGPVVPTPLASHAEVHVRLDGDPVGRPGAEIDCGAEGDPEVVAAYQAVRRPVPVRENGAWRAAAVLVEGDVERVDRAAAVEVDAGSVDLPDRCVGSKREVI